jgi:hypothetical protein
MPKCAMSQSDRAAGPGWYADPFERHNRRFFDGTKWTHQVSDDNKTDLDRPGARPSHIVVTHTVSDDGTVTGLEARMQGRSHTPDAPYRTMALLTAGASVAFLIAALADRNGRWSDLGLGLMLGVASVLPFTYYRKFRRHPPMLIVTPAGLTCWNVFGPPRAASASDIASIASFTRTGFGRSVMPIVTISVNLKDGTNFATDCVTAPQTSADERAILVDLVGQIRAILHLQQNVTPS